jgi:hypothetical protein
MITTLQQPFYRSHAVIHTAASIFSGLSRARIPTPLARLPQRQCRPSIDQRTSDLVGLKEELAKCAERQEIQSMADRLAAERKYERSEANFDRFGKETHHYVLIQY